MQKLAILGLGAMGHPIARNLAAKRPSDSETVVAVDADPARLAGLDAPGLVATADPAAFEGAEVLFLCLPNGDVVEAALASRVGDPAGAFRSATALARATREADWPPVLQAYARCKRIVKDQAEPLPVEPGRYTEPATRGLYEAWQAERERLGPVNLVAEQELAELEAGAQGNAAERAELGEAIHRLRGSIGALNREGRQRLQAAFEAVDTHFRRLFTTLFDGGQAHLELIDSDDPLEAGL